MSVYLCEREKKSAGVSVQRLKREECPEKSFKIEERREKTEKKEELKRDSFFYFLFFCPKPIFFSPFFAVSKRKRRFARGTFVRLPRVSLRGVLVGLSSVCAAPQTV